MHRTRLDELDFLRPEVVENQTLFATGRQVDLQQGDAFFHSKLFHAVGRNDSEAVKTSVAFAYRGEYLCRCREANQRQQAKLELPVIVC